jgi:hypothetical protein
MPALSPPARTVRWGWFAAGAVSAAAAATVLVAFVLPSEEPDGAGVRSTLEAAGLPVQVRGAHHRAAHEATPITVSAGDEVVLVGLTVEAPPRSPLEVEMLGSEGEVLARTELSLDDPSGLVLISVVASQLPATAGEFHVRVSGTDESFRYPFRVDRRGR